MAKHTAERLTTGKVYFVVNFPPKVSPLTSAFLIFDHMKYKICKLNHMTSFDKGGKNNI